MKNLFTLLLLVGALSSQAQQNKLLDQAFWKSLPDANAVKSAVADGNSPSQFNGNSFDPVVLAINAGAPNESIEYLLSQPGNEVTKPTHDGRIYLHWAANKGNVELVKYLLDKGSKTSLMDSHGTTPMLFAAGAGQTNVQIYEQFLSHGVDLKTDLNQDGANALLAGIANDKELTLTNYFISKGLEINSVDAAGNNAFSYAARSGNIELLKKLVEKGVKPNSTAVLMAAQAGGGRNGGNIIGLPVYQYLESLNLKPNVKGKGGETALHYVVRKPNQLEVIQYFLSKGVDVNQPDENGNTAFMNAAASTRDTAVLALLAPKVKDVNLANKKGQTALMLAVGNNTAGVINYLIAKGASVTAVDKNGNNLAYYIVDAYRTQQGQGGPAAQGSTPRQDDFDTKLAILKDKGLNIAAQQKNGNTLYHVAVAKGNLALLKRLEPLGIDVNARNTEGLTALHKAAMIAKDDTIMKYLLSIGAKKDAVTNFKETAFDLASENESLTKNNTSVNFLK
ncbi:ankyrin repeat domain-containing protein [Mucilaginibacter sp.]|uniref:ankyrin repeat domain-containing protein n=1 Tax=Mucilaginibacter sp. TaxID=1882438 RepID=UPI0035BC1BA5